MTIKEMIGALEAIRDLHIDGGSMEVGVLKETYGNMCISSVHYDEELNEVVIEHEKR